MLIRSLQQPHMPLVDLPSQHCVALSAFADKHRHVAKCMGLRGLILGCRVVKSLTQGSWPLLVSLELYNIPHLGIESSREIGSGCPQLQYILLSNNELDAYAISAITQAKWPNLEALDMQLSTSGIQILSSCSWH